MEEDLSYQTSVQTANHPTHNVKVPMTIQVKAVTRDTTRPQKHWSARNIHTHIHIHIYIYMRPAWLSTAVTSATFTLA